MSVICKKYVTAVESQGDAQEYFDNLTGRADQAAVRQWTREIENAEKGRMESPAMMDIMAPPARKGEH